MKTWYSHILGNAKKISTFFCMAPMRIFPILPAFLSVALVIFEYKQINYIFGIRNECRLSPDIATIWENKTFRKNREFLHVFKHEFYYAWPITLKVSFVAKHFTLMKFCHDVLLCETLQMRCYVFIYDAPIQGCEP